MAKKEITESVTWTITCEIIGASQEDVEHTIEAIESNLDDAADGVEDMSRVEDYTVRMS